MHYDHTHKIQEIDKKEGKREAKQAEQKKVQFLISILGCMLCPLPTIHPL